jgi:hypothetical protein
LASFCVWTKILVCKRCFTGIQLFRSASKSEDFRFPVSRLDDVSSRPDNVPYCPDARQTKHHPFGRCAFPSGPSTVLKRFCPTCILPDVSAASPDASLYSNNFRFFPSSNKGKINQPSGRCGINQSTKICVLFLFPH